MCSVWAEFSAPCTPKCLTFKTSDGEKYLAVQYQFCLARVFIVVVRGLKSIFPVCLTLDMKSTTQTKWRTLESQVSTTRIDARSFQCRGREQL